jgi:hypothetical protein
MPDYAELTLPDPPHCDICGAFTSELIDGACKRCHDVWRSAPLVTDGNEFAEDCYCEEGCVLMGPHDVCVVESPR